MINAATVIREHCSLMADLDCLQWAGRRMHERIVRLPRMVDEVEETELVAPLAGQLAAIRRDVESSLWGIYSTPALAPMLAELSDLERGPRMRAELAALSQQADKIWGVPSPHIRENFSSAKGAGPGLQTSCRGLHRPSACPCRPFLSVRRCAHGEAKQEA